MIQCLKSFHEELQVMSNYYTYLTGISDSEPFRKNHTSEGINPGPASYDSYPRIAQVEN
jgi:hypothetical protein